MKLHETECDSDSWCLSPVNTDHSPSAYCLSDSSTYQMSHYRKVAQSDEMFSGGQQQSVRRYMSAGSIPIAQTPRLSALSPLYPLPSSPNSVVFSIIMDDAIGDLFTRYLPLFFDLLEKFQYQKVMRCNNYCRICMEKRMWSMN